MDSEFSARLLRAITAMLVLASVSSFTLDGPRMAASSTSVATWAWFLVTFAVTNVAAGVALGFMVLPGEAVQSAAAGLTWVSVVALVLCRSTAMAITGGYPITDEGVAVLTLLAVCVVVKLIK